MLRQVPEGKEAGPARRAPGAAGQERTRRGAGDRRGAQAQSRPVRHLGPGPALRPQFRSPPPPTATRPRRGPGSRKSRPTTERQPPASDPGPDHTFAHPAPQGLWSPRAGGGGGELVGWVCPVLSPLTARPGCALSPRHPRPRLAAIPTPSLAATPPRLPHNPGRRAHANPAIPPSRPATRKHRDAPARERPREPREDVGHAKGTGWHRRRSRREATRAPHSPQLLRRGVGSTARGLLGCRTGARA